MQNTHTPGPWHRNARLDAGTHSFVWGPAADGKSRLVADCGGILVRTAAEMEANAALIASAPDMLAALEAIAAMLDQPVQHSGISDPAAAAILRGDARVARELARKTVARIRGAA